MTISYPIPENVNLITKEGSELNFETVLFEKKINKLVSINVATQLKINPKNVFRYIKKLVGEKIEKGKIIAFKKNLFTEEKVFSPDDGIIKEIDHHQGTVVLETSTKRKNEIKSPFKGIVEKIDKNNLTISLSHAQEFSLKKSSGDFGGEVFIFNKNHDFLSTNVANKIIVCENITSYLQTKTEALGVKGYVTLHELPETTELASAQLKNIDDFKRIVILKDHYCTVISNSANIYFYK